MLIVHVERDRRKAYAIRPAGAGDLCGRGDLDPHRSLEPYDFRTTSAFARRSPSIRRVVVWTSLRPIRRRRSAARLVSTKPPPPGRQCPAGLARDHPELQASPEFERVLSSGFPGEHSRCRRPLLRFKSCCVYQFRHALHRRCRTAIRADWREGPRFAKALSGPPDSEAAVRNERRGSDFMRKASPFPCRA